MLQLCQSVGRRDTLLLLLNTCDYELVLVHEMPDSQQTAQVVMIQPASQPVVHGLYLH